MFWDEVMSLVLLSKEGIKDQLVSCDVCCPDGRVGRLGGVCVQIGSLAPTNRL